MSEKRPKTPALIESPVRVDVELKADITEAINKLTAAGIDLGSTTVRPVGAALAELVVSMLDWCRGPFQRKRVRQLIALAKDVKELREAQGIAEAKALPDRTQQRIIDEASFVEDDRLRKLWAQLIVNAQAGMQIEDYLFELLGKLSSADAEILNDAGASRGRISIEMSETEKLEALGVLEVKRRVKVTLSDRAPVGSMREDIPAYEAKAELEHEAYGLTPLGWALYHAVRAPQKAELLRPTKVEFTRRGNLLDVRFSAGGDLFYATAFEEELGLATIRLKPSSRRRMAELGLDIHSVVSGLMTELRQRIRASE